MSNPLPEHMAAEVAALLERRRVVQAKARLKHALQEYPDHLELLLQSAWAEYLDGDNAAALTTVRQVLTRNPDSQSARILLYQLLLEQRALADAERVILDLLRDYPEHAAYYGAYAELMIRAMKLAKARALSDEGLRYDPDNAGCLASRALCDFIEQPQGSTSHALQQLLARHPESVRTLALILVALQERNDDRGALRIAQELVRAQPDNEHLVGVAAQLKTTTHWSMWPLWPLRRWGWSASVALWLISIVAVHLVGRSNSAAAGLLGLGILAYAIYSWLWPPLLRRWLARP